MSEKPPYHADDFVTLRARIDQKGVGRKRYPSSLDAFLALGRVEQTISQLTKELEEARGELRRMKALAMSYSKELDKLTICRCGHPRDLHSADMNIGEGKMSHGAFRCFFGEGCECCDYESAANTELHATEGNENG